MATARGRLQQNVAVAIVMRMSRHWPIPSFTPETVDLGFRGRADLARVRALAETGNQDGDDLAVVQLWLAHARALERRGDLGAAHASAQQAQTIAETIADPAGRGAALTTRALIEHRWGNHAASAALAREGIALLGEHLESVRALAAMGASAYEQSHFADAEHWYHESIGMARRLDDKLGLSNALHNLALIKLWQGSFALCLRYAEEANDLQRTINGVEFSLPLHGAYVYLALNQRQQAQQAVEALGKAVASIPLHRGTWHVIQAELALDNEQFDLAREHAEAAHTAAIRTGLPYFESASRATLSRYWRLSGNAGAAQQWAQEALTQARRTGYRYMEAHNLIELGQATLAGGHVEEALGCFGDACAIAHEIDARYEEAHALLLLAIVQTQQSSSDARDLWLRATHLLLENEYLALVERERRQAYPVAAAWSRSKDREAQQAATQLLARLGKVAPLPLHIRGLGDFHLAVGARIVERRDLQRRKVGELLRFLLLRPSLSAPRDTVIDALWPDQSPGGGVDLLYLATSALRRLLEPDLPDKFPSRYLAVDGDRIGLLIPHGSTVDFLRFRSLLADRHPTAASLDEALALYQNDLYPEDQYADWSAPVREQLAMLQQHALLERARLHLGADEPASALETCRTLLRRDACHEEATLVAMQAALALQDRPTAIRLYRALEKALDTDFGIAPRADIVRFASQLQSDG